MNLLSNSVTIHILIFFFAEFTLYLKGGKFEGNTKNKMLLTKTKNIEKGVGLMAGIKKIAAKKLKVTSLGIVCLLLIILIL